MEHYCSTGQSPQRAVAPTEEDPLTQHGTSCTVTKSHIPEGLNFQEISLLHFIITVYVVS